METVAQIPTNVSTDLEVWQPIRCDRLGRVPPAVTVTQNSHAHMNALMQAWRLLTNAARMSARNPEPPQQTFSSNFWLFFF